MKENIKLGAILLIFASIAGFILGGANLITKEPIAKQIEKANNDAMRDILPEAESFKKVEVKIDKNSIVKEVNEGYSKDKSVGYAVKVSPKGYGGLIEMMVGISRDGKVEGIKILSHTETPGLGANAVNPSFSGQFKNKPIEQKLEVVKRVPSKDNEIDAITGATITSKAVTNGVNEAVEFYRTALKGGNK